MMHELKNESEPELPALLERLTPCDLVLVEGFKKQAIPKIEIHRLPPARRCCFPTIPML